MSRQCIISLCHSLCFFLLFASLSTDATTLESKDPILLKADNVTHKNDLGVIVASGNVEISDGKNILVADRIIYNQKTKMVTATGHVKLYYFNGDIISTEYLEVTDDFRDGFIEQVYLLTTDNSRLAAHKTRKTEKSSVFDYGLFSPCKLLGDEKNAIPTWQIRATEIYRDEEAEDVDYINPRIEFLGLPLIYMPFLRHADPSVERRSGFLPMILGFGSNIGTMVGLPYYFALSQQDELILEPFLTTEGGVFLTGQYNRRFSNGMLKMQGGVGYTDNKNGNEKERWKYKKRYLGHLFASGIFNINEHWRFKFDLNKVDDRPYLKRYTFLDPLNLGTKNFLNSTAEMEGFYGKNYALIKAFWFQDLRAKPANNPDFYKQTPFIFPYLSYQHVSEPNEAGGYLEVDMNSMYLSRIKGGTKDLNGVGLPYAKPQSVQRFVVQPTYTWPFLTHDGSQFEVKTSLRASMYSVSGFQQTKNHSKWKGTFGRAFPQMGVFWRKPYIGQLLNNDVIIEPRTSLILGPNGMNTNKIPNEDSQDFELDPSNLFALDRFPGYDRFDTGQRFNYGITMDGFMSSTSTLKFFVGQSYSFSAYKDIPNPHKKGLYKGFSDYLAKATLGVQQTSLSVSTMLDRKKLTPKRTQVNITTGPSYFRTTIGYIYVSDVYFDQVSNNKRHQVQAKVTSALTENWDLSTNISYNLSHKPGALYYTVDLTFHNDCFKFGFMYQRTYFRDRNISPGDTYFITFGLKHLGEYQTGPLGYSEGIARPSNRPF